MSRPSGRAGTGGLQAGFLVAALCTLLAPFASAQGAASLTVEPPAAEPGTIVIATFAAGPATPVVDVSAQERVTCLLIGASGESSACDLVGGPLELRVLAGDRIYTIPFVAPAEAGAYEVRITRAPLMDTAALASEAIAALNVILPEPVDAGTDEGPVVAPEGSTTNIWNVFLGADDADAQGAPDAGPDAQDDAARWMVSSTAGTGTLLLLLVGSRGRLGGLP